MHFRGHAVPHRAGRARGRLLPDSRPRPTHTRSSDDVESRQLRGPIGELASGLRSGPRRRCDDRPRDGRAQAPRDRRSTRRRPNGRPGAREARVRSSRTSSRAPTSRPGSRSWPRAPRAISTGVANSVFGFQAKPQTWALGVKEVWEVERPLDRVIHTMGWPLRSAKRYREFGGSFIYPMGENRIALGMVVGLDYADAKLSVHDLLQELKTHPFVRPISPRRQTRRLGSQDDSGGRLLSLPERFSFPGGMVDGRLRRARQRAGLEGDPLRHAFGDAGRRVAVDAIAPRSDSLDARGARRLRRRSSRELHPEGPRARPEHAPRVPERLHAWCGGRRHGHSTRSASSRRET